MPSTHQSGPPCTLPGLPPQRPPVSWPSMSPSWYASLLTRQSATVFNQPLSLDMSSVTHMDYMFNVRSARAHATAHQSGLPCTLLRLPLPRPPVFWASMSPSQHASPFDSAVGDGVQPAAESQHVQSHKNELRVFGALRACPCHPCTSQAFPARYLGCRTHALPSPGPLCRPHSASPL